MLYIFVRICNVLYVCLEHTRSDLKLCLLVIDFGRPEETLWPLKCCYVTNEWLSVLLFSFNDARGLVLTQCTWNFHECISE